MSVYSLVLLIMGSAAVVEGRNPTTYPYDGEPDSSRYSVWMPKAPLNFHSPAEFSSAQFDSTAEFSSAQFDNTADFSSAQFNSTAEFSSAQFNSTAELREAQFDSTADFRFAQFDSTADFRFAQFDGTAYFRFAQFDSTADFSIAQFDSTADFRSARFNSTAEFSRARFNSTAEFSAQFDGTADFRRAQFDSTAEFSSAQFNSTAEFREVQFDNTADFRRAQFDSTADFRRAQFDSTAEFRFAQFNSTAEFRFAQFNSTAEFRFAQFNSTAEFHFAQFDGTAEFHFAQFDGTAEFRRAKIGNRLRFKEVVFTKAVDFREAEFDTLGIADFNSAWIIDTLFAGSSSELYTQRFDLSLVKLLPGGTYVLSGKSAKAFPSITDTTKTDTSGKDLSEQAEQTILSGPGAHIVLEGPVEMKIQHEKLEFVSLLDTLDYFTKKVIVDGTKQASFKGDEYKHERFEMDFIFEKSTLYQKKTTTYEVYSRFHPWFWLQSLYYYAMGLGYRPFWLIWWILGIIVLFGGIYMIWIPDPVRQYVYRDDPTKLKPSSLINPPRLPFTENLINCLYFSAMLLFTVRLKKDLLTSFELRHKRFIVFEWLLGVGIYGAFLALSKAGSILHNLKSLFLG